MPGITDKAQLRTHMHSLLKKKHPSDWDQSESLLEEFLEEFFVYHQELEFQNEELRRIQKELEISRTKLTELFDLAPIAYVITDDLGKLVQINKTFLTTLGLDLLEVKNRLLSDFISPDYQDSFYFHFETVTQSSEPKTASLAIKTARIDLPVIVCSNSYEQNGRLFVRSVFLLKELCDF